MVETENLWVQRDEKEEMVTYWEVGGEYCETLQFCRYDKLRLSIVRRYIPLFMGRSQPKMGHTTILYTIGL